MCPSDSQSSQTEPGEASARTVLTALSGDESIRIEGCLREDGLQVESCNPQALAARIDSLSPFALIVDIEHHEAETALRGWLLGGGPTQPHLVAIGSRERAEGLGIDAQQEHARLFERPYSDDELIAYIHELATFSASDGEAPEGTDGGRVAAGATELPQDRDFPALEGLAEVESILPKLAGEPTAMLRASTLSPEIEALLNDTAEQIRSQDAEPAPPARPVEVIVGPEVLAGLEELLSPRPQDTSWASGHDAESVAPEAEAAKQSAAGGGTQSAEPAANPLGLSRGHTLVGHHAPSSEVAQETAVPEGPSNQAGSTLFEPLATEKPPDSDLQAYGPRFEPRPQYPPLPIHNVQISAQPDGISRPSGAKVGDPVELLAEAIRERVTGSLALTGTQGMGVRRIILRDGDLVNAASDIASEALGDFLVARGNLSADMLSSAGARLPTVGRHAAAALIAKGYLGQDDLWPVLRAHAEWLIGRALLDAPAACRFESEPPEHLRAEPNVFGGAAGAEVFVEAIRRALPTATCLRRLGGSEVLLSPGPATSLLAESALSPDIVARIKAGMGRTAGEALPADIPDFLGILTALQALGVIVTTRTSLPPAAPQTPQTPQASAEFDPLDAEAIRRRVAARLALVHEGDYFALLGLQPDATPYEVKRAYLDLRRHFDAAALLTAATADLQDEVALIAEVIEEAYEILRDPLRCERYRTAIEAVRQPADLPRR